MKPKITHIGDEGTHIYIHTRRAPSVASKTRAAEQTPTRKVMCSYWHTCDKVCRHAEEHEPDKHCRKPCKVYKLARCTQTALRAYGR